MRRGQSALESMLAVVAITFGFLLLMWLSQTLTRKILVQHAAMRVARARTVGLNDFMCLKTARLSVLPAAGRRLRPEEDLTVEEERARFTNYLLAPRPGIAKALLDYEGWSDLDVEAGDGTDVDVAFTNVTGNAGVEQNFTLYMLEGGR